MLSDLIHLFGIENPRVQELIILYVREGNNYRSPILNYANLLKKLKHPYDHNPSIRDVTLVNDDIEEALHFTINPEILHYIPVSQKALATLDDIDEILGDNVDEMVKGVRNYTAVSNYGADFRDFFKAPFSEEKIMLQAMVKKFKKMGIEGKNKLAGLMIDMAQCKPGKNQAIWDHYSAESQPLFMADLKNVTTWLVRLQDKKNPYISDEDLKVFYGKSRDQISTIIFNMLKNDHIMRRHFSDIKTEDAQRLKALLGSIIDLERNYDSKNRIALGNTLKQALDILLDLSNAETFYQNLDQLCQAHQVYLPADKFDGLLSFDAIENLILKLTEKDVDGLGNLSELQDEMRQFVAAPHFVALLEDFKNESGDKLRELIIGYINNNWSGALLTLMISARDQKLEDVVDELFKHVSIDKDMPLSWLSLKKLIMNELIDLKRQSINALVEKITGQNHAICPHDAYYIEGLLGGAIGLRDASKMPDFNIWDMEHPNTLSKSVQDVLDLFHEEFTPDTIINHLISMLHENKLSIVEPETGGNIIWQMINSTVQDQLKLKNVEHFDLADLLYDDQHKDKAQRLALALLLSKLGILKEVNETGNIIMNNNYIID